MKQLPLENFDLGWVDRMRTSVYYRTKPDRWGYWSANATTLNVSTVQPGSFSHKYLERHSLSDDEFLKDFEVPGRNHWPSAAKVLVIGSDPSKRCAVFLSPEDKQEAQPVIRYFFPLKAEGSD